ncbi:hypothetical protein PAXINDRAFT_158391 [Paxillus involutus ATCC 200175]|uniref:Unplaced genomic scaffold PAXINscaffold_539, whole genome shotgun sequence n=1 Tax=Paxillus involutus ATCC 200175 TaxID=664439 RepID=A0A0C9SX47_PAXIN|nr:hypothetical protein PAXINDRAFT_158391 [Paxillus involutus ATCC 200175]
MRIVEIPMESGCGNCWRKCNCLCGNYHKLRSNLTVRGVLMAIRNWAMHDKIYLVKCQEANATPNHLAIPPTVTIGDDGSVTTIPTGASQGSLNGFMQQTAKSSKEGMLEHIVEFLVREDQYQCPRMKESDIPHQTKLQDEILAKATEVEAKLCEHLKGVPGQISITFNAWTSSVYDPYLIIMAHYIDSLAGQPNEWKLKARTLAFTAIDRDHSGANTAGIITQVVQWYGLCGKAVDKFCLIADSSSKVPKLKKKKYADYIHLLNIFMVALVYPRFHIAIALQIPQKSATAVVWLDEQKNQSFTYFNSAWRMNSKSDSEEMRWESEVDISGTLIFLAFLI